MTQISLGIRPVWSESSLCSWRNYYPFKSYPTPYNPIRLAQMMRLTEMARVAGVFQGIRTSIAKKPYIFVIGPPVPPLDPHMPAYSP